MLAVLLCDGIECAIPRSGNHRQKRVEVEVHMLKLKKKSRKKMTMTVRSDYGITVEGLWCSQRFASSHGGPP